MKILSFVFTGLSVILLISLHNPVYGSQGPPTFVAPSSHTIEGDIVGKGMVVWEESLTPLQEYRLTREYLVLRISSALQKFIVLEFEPLFISVDQFHLGEKIQAQVGEDGSLISARHVNE